MNTRLTYLYRDADNYKKLNTIVIAGEMSEKQQQTILSCLMDGEHFIPSVVGLPEERFGSWTEADHIWFELEAGFATQTESKAQLKITTQELVDRFLAAMGNWEKLYGQSRYIG